MNKMLVPGYVNPEELRAIAKLSGVNPSEVKYKRPNSPSTRNQVGTANSGQPPMSSILSGSRLGVGMLG